MEFQFLQKLKIGVILATFHESGNWPLSMDVLNKEAKEFLIYSKASFIKYCS